MGGGAVRLTGLHKELRTRSGRPRGRPGDRAGRGGGPPGAERGREVHHHRHVGGAV